jgi:hypothetical protein
MRRAGLIAIIYALMLSYFGVGSIRNAIMLPSVPDVLRGFTAFYGLSWAACIAGAVLMMLGRPAGIGIARAALAASALAFTVGAMLTGVGGTGATSVLFTVSRPLYDIFLFKMLPLLAREPAMQNAVPRTTALALAAAGAGLPWAAWLAAWILSAGPLMLTRSPGILISAFMSLWSALPFFVLVLTAWSWPSADGRRAVLAGGGIGTAAAGLAAYGLLWSENFNVFLLALLPPVVYAGQAAGIVIGSLLPRRPS